MKIQLEKLTDEELQYIVKSDLIYFLEPIKQNQKHYTQYTSLLGNMSKKSLLVPKNLPNIAVKLYNRQDANYVKAMEKHTENLCLVLLELAGETLERDITQEEFCEFSNNEIADMILKYQKGDKNSFDIELFKIQLKLIGFPRIEDRIQDICSLCGIEGISNEVASTEENVPETTISEEKPLIEDKTIPTERKAKPKKLTSEEKAAKNKAALAAKEKAKEAETVVQENEVKPVEDAVVVKSQEAKIEDVKVQVENNTNVIDTEEETMSRYIGVINTRLNYYNFTPIGVYEDGLYTAFYEHDIDAILPNSMKHNINFYYNPWDDAHVQFMKEKFIEGFPVLLNCEIDELEDNRNSDGTRNVTGYKMPALDGWNKKKITPLSEMGLYVVLTKEELLDDIGTKKALRIQKDGLVAGQMVLINTGDAFYAGPFMVKYSSANDTYFISMQEVEEKHFLYGYSASDCSRIIVETSDDVSAWIGYSSWCYYVIKDNASRIVKDIISDRELLDSFKETLEKASGLDYSNLDVESIIDTLGNSLIIGGEDLPREIQEARIDRIRKIMSAEESLVELYAETSDLICELLLKNKDSMQTESLLSEFFAKRPDLLEKMAGVRAAQAKVDSAKAELEQLEVQRAEIEAKFKDIQEQSLKTEEKKVNTEEILSEELLAKKAELDAIIERINVAESVEELQEEIKRLKGEVTYYESHKSHLVNDTKTLQSKFVEFIGGYSDKMADITFDGFMSSKMLQAAANWETKAKNEELDSKVVEINGIPSQEMDGEELVDYLVKTVQTARPGYTKNAIVNIFTCAAQGFLTVFSGMPGCGKTSICNIVSKVLGLNGYNELPMDLKDTSRYISVSVERGWTSKRDFIGYYNPLTKAFEESNRQVFDGLRILDMEKKKGYSKWPFIILLDEANLSPMEYYWADFMNVCDDLTDNASINLGNENIFQIPETLHFLATINNDHTTETLSPRLIDRAWIITLPKFSSVQLGHEIKEDHIKNVTWSNIKAVFTASGYDKKSFDRETQMAYEGIKEKLSKVDLYVSPRVEISIQQYWVVASKLMDEDEYGNSANLVALDYAVAQKILPKISGSGDEYETWLVELKTYCDSKGLSHSAELLEEIISRGNRQMKYYQFFN